MTTTTEERPKILLAEDNLVNQKVAVKMLNRFGFEVEIAENGRVALRMATSQQYHLILMDCQMPEMDGYEATLALRNHFSGKEQPFIIALTANSLADDYDKCLAAGMDDYLAKPVVKEDLQRILEKWLSRHGTLALTR